jgi:release factor glutamine methyltransferase
VTFYDEAVAARARLIDAGIQPDNASRDADLLARLVLGWDLATWLAKRHEPATAAFSNEFKVLLTRRLAREPMAYIRGSQEFWGRDFTVTPAVLIPRPETELLVETAGEFLKRLTQPSVVDVGTGSGCIAITLALEYPTATVRATDISEEALAVARANAARLGADVTFVAGSLLAGVPPPVDLIVSNPPYVAERVRAGLSREVRDHEPAVALFGGLDGWHTIRALLALTPGTLAPDGVLLMELGYGQSEDLAAEVDAVSGLRIESIRSDLQGIARVAVIRRRP